MSANSHIPEQSSPSTKAKSKVKWVDEIIVELSILDVSFRNKLHRIFEDLRVVKYSPTWIGKVNQSLFQTCSPEMNFLPRISHHNRSFWDGVSIVINVTRGRVRNDWKAKKGSMKTKR